MLGPAALIGTTQQVKIERALTNSLTAVPWSHSRIEERACA
jgi:hypothetical protein